MACLCAQRLNPCNVQKLGRVNAWKLALKANLHAFTLPMELATPLCPCIARYVVDCVMGP